MSSPDRDSLGSDEVRSPASDTSDMPALKDCRICGKDASGMHYGCQSCSRCKAFFRRAVLSSVTTQCCRAMLCAKTDCIEQMCRSCRYKKCLDMGMDPKAIHPPHDTIGKRQRPSSAVSIVEMPSAPMDINSNQLEFMAQLTFMDNTIRRKKLESVWQRSGFVLPIELANSPRGFAMPNDMADMARADIFSLTEWLRTIPIMDDLSSDEQRTLCMRYAVPHLMLEQGYFSAQVPVDNMWFYYNGKCVPRYTRTDPIYETPVPDAIRARHAQVYKQTLMGAMDDVAAPLRRLKLSPEEFLVLKIMMLLSIGDHCAEDDATNFVSECSRRRICHWRNRVVKALFQFYEATRQPNQEERFGELMLAISGILSASFAAMESFRIVRFFERAPFDDATEKMLFSPN